MLTNATEAIKALADENGNLPSFAWPGGYPLYYVDKENNVLCPECASQNGEFSAPLVAYDLNYEDPDLYCDFCSQRIPSAYVENDDLDSQGEIDQAEYLTGLDQD